MLKTLILLSTLLGASCISSTDSSSLEEGALDERSVSKVQVLNFATFHMGSTSDATSVEFDERDRKNQEDAHNIAERLAEFSPTILCVETLPEIDEELNGNYQRYLADPTQASTYYGEVGLVAFEIGRLCGLTQLHGIDHRMDYNYRIG
ncbi:MAG: DUF5694 domain-containing protein, partial [Planctomycetota bacterium]